MKACPLCQFRYPSEATYCFVDGAELTAIVDPLIGTTLAGRYVIEDRLGEGGMATVYRARYAAVDRPCAVKIVNPGFAADPTVCERFRREARSTRALGHPNVVEIFDQGEREDGTPYIVMELLEGETLSSLLDKGTLKPERGVPIMIQIARGMARAHDLGVIHRDMKPDNIFLCPRLDGGDQVKILDFGIARSRNDPRLTSAGELFGTPQYLAPERIIGGDAGPSVDLYAAGVIFFEMVTSRLPFEADDPSSFLVKHVNETPPAPRALNPSVPAALDELIVQLLRKDPRARPVDAHRVAKDLEAIARRIGAIVPPEPDVDPESAPPPVSFRPGVMLDTWRKRIGVFGEMLARAHRGASAGEQERTLTELQHVLKEFEAVRGQCDQEQRNLEEIEARGREGRQRFGVAVDATGLDASRAKDELRAARIEIERSSAQVHARTEAYMAAQVDLLTWEGRAVRSEPTVHLANAYRACAEAVEAWLEAHRHEHEAQRTGAVTEQTVQDLTYQLGELRAALANHEQGIERERTTAKTRVVELNTRAERIEARLLQLAAAFCSPLRAQPELGELFSSLESSRSSFSLS